MEDALVGNEDSRPAERPVDRVAARPDRPRPRAARSRPGLSCGESRRTRPGAAARATAHSADPVAARQSHSTARKCHGLSKPLDTSYKTIVEFGQEKFRRPRKSRLARIWRGQQFRQLPGRHPRVTRDTGKMRVSQKANSARRGPLRRFKKPGNMGGTPMPRGFHDTLKMPVLRLGHCILERLHSHVREVAFSVGKPAEK